MRRADPLMCCLGVLAVANLLNNRIARRWAPLTSAVATGTLLLVARREGLTWPELGWRGARRGARLGGVVAAAVAAGYAAGVANPGTRPLFHDARAQALSRRRLAEEVLVQVPVGTVLLEEVGFRGVLPALLGRRLPPGVAAAAAAALFGLWHVLPALEAARANPALGRLASTRHPSRPGPGREAGDRAGPGSADGGGGMPAVPGVGEGEAPATTGLMAVTVVATAMAGLLLHRLCRGGGLLASSLAHLATNSLGYLAARAAALISPSSAAGDADGLPGRPVKPT